MTHRNDVIRYEYPEPTRSELMDLFFSQGMGTRWQGLKVEIGGDVESSYGSMSSYMHVPDPAKASFNRGVEFWLMKEASVTPSTFEFFFKKLKLEDTDGLHRPSPTMEVGALHQRPLEPVASHFDYADVRHSNDS